MSTSTTPRRHVENEDDDDADNKDDDPPTTSRRWKTARYVTRLVSDMVQPMLNVAVAETVRLLQYDQRSFLPGFVTSRLADPFLALRNCVDESLLFEKGIADISEAFMRQAAAAAVSALDDDKKRRSLRRVMTARAGKLTGSGEHSTVGEDGLRKTLGNLDEQKRIAKIITGEAERVALRLSVVSEVFVTQLTALVNIRDRQRQMDLLTFVPFILVHPSVARHPRLGRLKLGDNTLILEVGRAYVREFILLETYAQAFYIENAERRYTALARHADQWLSEKFASAVIGDMLPVDWFLDAHTHEPLDESVLSERREAMRREVPFMMIGLLHTLRMHDERDLIVWSIYQKLV